MLGPPVTSVLGQDPNRVHNINANSFQQHVITTVNGWQFAAFYTDATSNKVSCCYVNLARRQIFPLAGVGEWQFLTFEDYEQTADDGHNAINIGVCKGDGTIHVAFDHHCDQLRFRISNFGVASSLTWNPSLFTSTQNFLPGIAANDMMKEVTYPRFVNIEDDLILTYRIGQAGLGSDILYRYSSTTHTYTYLGQHLTGISNSPYINGLDYRLFRLHVSWCYRNFVAFSDSAPPGAHKQQAGPNGPENNCDLNYAFSDDLGETWKSSDGRVLAKIGGKKEPGVEETVNPGAVGARVFEIPTNSGVLNQEAQAADWKGGFWVLNRERIETGEEKWIVYRRDLAGKWTRIIIQSTSEPTDRGARGSVCVDRVNNVYLILPGNSDSSLDIMQAQKDDYGTFKSIWRSDGYEGEPLADVGRLEVSDVLSVFTRTAKSQDRNRSVVVLDFSLAGGAQGAEI